MGHPRLASRTSRACSPEPISERDHTIASALPFSQIETLRIFKAHGDERPARFADEIHL
jgi:hypothetical protein